MCIRQTLAEDMPIIGHIIQPEQILSVSFFELVVLVLLALSGSGYRRIYAVTIFLLIHLIDLYFGIVIGRYPSWLISFGNEWYVNNFNAFQYEDTGRASTYSLANEQFGSSIYKITSDMSGGTEQEIFMCYDTEQTVMFKALIPEEYIEVEKTIMSALF